MILLIDDDSELTGMLAEYLAGEGFAATAVGTALQGLAAASTGDFDAIVLDVMLPGGNGVDMLRTIRATSDVPIIMLTAKGSDAERVAGLEAGADDYVTKPYFAPELVARLRAVLRRPRASAGKDRLEVGSLSLDPARRRVDWAGTEIELTQTEFNLLEALLRADGRVVTKDDLTFRLLGRRRQSYDRSIDVHSSNLRLKMERATGASIRIETVRGVGWRIER